MIVIYIDDTCQMNIHLKKCLRSCVPVFTKTTNFLKDIFCLSNIKDNYPI